METVLATGAIHTDAMYSYASSKGNRVHKFPPLLVSNVQDSITSWSLVNHRAFNKLRHGHSRTIRQRAVALDQTGCCIDAFVE